MVIARPAWFTDSKLKAIPKLFASIMAGMPEFKTAGHARVTGGFSALGNPSSFHNLGVRRLRQFAHAEIVPVLSKYLREEGLAGYNLEQLIDRMMYRAHGKAPSAETWHRDEAPLAHASDIILGGWWNLDTEAQFFSCVPGSHMAVRGHAGFAPIAKASHAACRAQSIRVDVPPGGFLLFYEHIIHEVLPVKASRPMHRLFLGWRLTRSVDPLFDIVPLLQSQAVIPLKSGQVPPMYPKLYWTNWRRLLTCFSQGFRKECLETRTVASGPRQGESHQVVHRFMRSLFEYKLPLYPRYHRREIEMHLPG
jgi:hypothetical protein